MSKSDDCGGDHDASAHLSGRVEYLHSQSLWRWGIAGPSAGDCLPLWGCHLIRVTEELAAATDDRLGTRDRELISAVGLLGLVSARQIERLFFDGADRSRIRRRSLQRLVDLGVLARLERRIGGVRAGSDGYVYVLDRLGRRLHEPERVGRLRTPEEPGLLFVRHGLAVSELYVLTVEAERSGRLDLLAWEAEPTCHRPFAGPLGAPQVLKPDAYLRIGLGAYEDHWFVELDTGSHRRGAIRRKLDIYLAYFKSGREQARGGVFPKVLWVATSEPRADRLSEWIEALPTEARGLFAVTTMADFRHFVGNTEAAL